MNAGARRRQIHSVHSAPLFLLLCAGLPAARAAAPAPGDAPARTQEQLVRYFPAYVLDSCRLQKMRTRKMLEFCAVSVPAGEGRRFVLTYRDPSRMEKNNIDTLLVASATLKTGKDEYLDYKKVVVNELDEGNHLILAPIVSGLPDDYKVARAVLYVFNERTLKMTPFWQSPPCTGCRDQRVHIGAAEDEQHLTIEYIRTSAGEEKSTALPWPPDDLSPTVRQPER